MEEIESLFDLQLLLLGELLLLLTPGTNAAESHSFKSAERTVD